MTLRLLLAALIACTACGLSARDLRTGEDAPNFKAGGTLINPPEFARELKDCRYNVILIYEWNMRDGTAAGLKTIQKYWGEHKGKGLCVFTISRLDHEKWPEVEAYCLKNKYTFPVAMGGFYDEDNDFFGYKADEGGFRATVVSRDGKVAYWGKDEWEEPLMAELEKIVYPNLEMIEVHKSVTRAAKYFAKREYGKALSLAEEVVAREDAEDEAKSDARPIIAYARDLASKRNERIDKWSQEGRHDLAYSTLELLESEFKGHEIGDKAEEARKEMNKDRDLKKELKAFEMLEKLKQSKGSGAWTGYVNALRAFARAQKDFKAAEVADKLADRIEFVMDE